MLHPNAKLIALVGAALLAVTLLVGIGRRIVAERNGGPRPGVDIPLRGM